MIFEDKYGEISIRQIGTPRCMFIKEMGRIYQHTLQVGFQGEVAQFQHSSFYNELSDKELLFGLKHFIEEGTGSEEEFEQFCINFDFDILTDDPNETDPATGYNKESIKAFKNCEKRRAQAERIGITLDMAYDILDVLQIKEYSYRGDNPFISLG